MPSLPPSIAQFSLDLLAVAGADGRIEWVNADRWGEVLGWREEDLVGHAFTEFIHPHDVARTEELANRAMVRGEPTRGYANRYRAADGTYRWLLWETRPLEHGRWLCAARDITTERETLREYDALRRVATHVAATPSPDAIFAAVAKEVGRLMEADAVGIVKLLGDRRLEIAGMWVGEGSGAFAQGQVVELDERRLERFLAGGVTRHHGPEESRDTLPGLRRYGSWVTVPVSVHGTEWGRITAFHRSPSGLPDDSEQRLAEFAALTAMAVANADARQQLERRALTDSLTDLMNHRAFFERLGAEIANAQRHGRPLAVAILDIDHFKAINDELGHRAGDRVLQELARALLRDQRLGDAIGRIGGDEIAVAFPDSGADGAASAIERVRGDLAARGGEPAITFSAGVCELRPGETLDALMRRADLLLYRSKDLGRARTSVER